MMKMMNVRWVMVISIVDVNEAQQRPQQEIQVNHNLLSHKHVSRNEIHA